MPIFSHRWVHVCVARCIDCALHAAVFHATNERPARKFELLNDVADLLEAVYVTVRLVGRV
jgi:hypothetical protein